MFLTYSQNKEFNVLDINRYEPVVAYARTEAMHTIIFLPKPNMIYSLESAVNSGILIGRPNFSLLKKDECIKKLKKLDKEPIPSNKSKYYEKFWLKVDKKGGYFLF